MQEAKSLHQIWQSYWSLLIKTGKGKGNQSLGNSIHSFNPLSRYFIFKTQAQPSAKLRDCVGPWGVLNFWALFIPTPPHLPRVPQPFLLFGYIFLTTLFLYSLETKKKNLTVGINYKGRSLLIYHRLETCAVHHIHLWLLIVVQSLSRVRLFATPWTCTPGFPVLHHLQECAQT